MSKSEQIQSTIRGPQSAVPYHFCTYFDRNYLLKGLALYSSLARHCRQAFTLWVLCFDDETYRVLSHLALPGMRLISQQEFEAGDEELLGAKANRSRVEYYWTCTPSLPLYVLKHNPDVDLVTYLDADLYFYASPLPLYRELQDGSILIMEHRHTVTLENHAQQYGIYNVAFNAFRRDQNGLLCLEWWRKRCIEWCYDRVEDGKFCDQKYLDDWPHRFKGVRVLQHIGAGLAPWNIHCYHLTCRSGKVYVESLPLLFYHFHRFALVNAWIFRPAHGYTFKPEHIEWIYVPYVLELDRTMRLVKQIAPDFAFPNLKLSRKDLIGGLRRGTLHSIFPAILFRSLRLYAPS